MQDWFSEELHGQWKQSLPVGPALVDQSSAFQRIQVYDTLGFGRMLVLDGKVQCTERDEFTYHEMLVHVPLLSHPNPRKVLVVGGGDGGTVREVLRHPGVEQVTLVEIDPEVIEVSRTWLPTMAVGLRDDPRLRIVTQDAAQAIEEVEAQDVLLIDSSDPEGPSEILFGENFFLSMRKALKPDGILAMQAGSPFFFSTQIAAARSKLKNIFTHVRPYLVAIPTYPGGTWCLISASPSIDPKTIPLSELQERMERRGIKPNYYSPEVQLGSMALPVFIDEL